MVVRGKVFGGSWGACVGAGHLKYGELWRTRFEQVSIGISPANQKIRKTRLQRFCQFGLYKEPIEGIALATIQN